MPRYLCLQRSLPIGPAGEATSDASSMADMPSRFAAWMATYSENLPDPGGPLGAGSIVVPDGTSESSVDPVAGSAGGYMIIDADDLDQAVDIARACPGLVRPGSGVEVIEVREP